MIKWLFILIIFIVVVSLIPDYSEEYGEEISKNIVLTKNVTDLESEINNLTIELNTFECPICESCAKCTDIDPNNTKKYTAADMQRYVIRIKELEYYLNEINDTDLYLEVKRNYTNLQQEYLECNQTLNEIKGII